jgi:proline iminopeptidase
MKTLYPELTPYQTHALVRDPHCLHVEESGNPSGIPIVVLHGGPGSGCKPYHRCFFNPEQYRIILFDQRGAGRSVPQGSTENNTTHHLLDDMEAIRQTLGITRWNLFGGSWGSTLGLLYAQRHPERVTGLILRGSFLARQGDMDWFLGSELRQRYPETWQACFGHLTAPSAESLVNTLHDWLNDEDTALGAHAAQAWFIWGSQVILGEAFDLQQASTRTDLAGIMNQTRLELHYAIHRYFIGENQILPACHRITHLPTYLIHGEKDMTCRMESSCLLAEALPLAQLTLLPDAGHTSSGPAMTHALVDAADALLEQLT